MRWIVLAEGAGEEGAHKLYDDVQAALNNAKWQASSQRRAYRVFKVIETHRVTANFSATIEKL